MFLNSLTRIVFHKMKFNMHFLMGYKKITIENIEKMTPYLTLFYFCLLRTFRMLHKTDMDWHGIIHFSIFFRVANMNNEKFIKRDARCKLQSLIKNVCRKVVGVSLDFCNALLVARG